MFDLKFDIWDYNKCNKISDKTDFFMNDENVINNQKTFK